ncbi:MAG: hypothetical protein ACI4TT_00935 [Christensenellales bacterium]
MNGIFGNTRQIDLSVLKDIQFDGKSIINDMKIAELKTILEQGLNNLANYYNKETTYSKTEINNLIANRQIYNIVTSLPTANISPSTIYLIKKINDGDETDTDSYDEYIYIQNKWEHVGSFEADFSNYYTKTETETAIANSKAELENSFNTLQTNMDTLSTKVGAIDDVLDAINGEVV